MPERKSKKNEPAVRVPRELAKAAAAAGKQRYSLTLYVAGMTRRSAAAIQTIREFCEERLPGRHDLEVVDIYRQPDRARGDQILAAPTLIKTLPPPLRRLIGDMSDKKRVLISLDIRDEHDEHSEKPAAAGRRAEQHKKRPARSD